MKSVLIAGYYGAENLGDEAILAATLGVLKGSCRITICSWQPELTETLHGVKAITWRSMSRIARAVSQAQLVIIGGGGIFQDYWGLNPNTYLRSNHGGITTYGSLAFLADLFGVPCLLFGVGIGPLNTELGKRHTLKTFLGCQAATLRDQQSYQNLLETGFQPQSSTSPEVSVAADLTFLAPARPADQLNVEGILSRQGIPPGRDLLGLNLRYWDRSYPAE